ncbi:hypothetical protein BGZ61DRAFT_40669 [Ilyonectria robusta]|uniref:uncharacterized protein n=1 Tax=Ilyonectria robusta TaxID=1079257 RepID=UPI001E8ED244|nr:uncharacterized protein BGZ61DRAFT_40669 [Ilyonectria robusta]KAH8688275.1 hypothetical protein BGZ61DRAFT_40669 [Ilyonectria robusta]
MNQRLLFSPSTNTSSSSYTRQTTSTSVTSNQSAFTRDVPSPAYNTVSSGFLHHHIHPITTAPHPHRPYSQPNMMNNWLLISTLTYTHNSSWWATPTSAGPKAVYLCLGLVGLVAIVALLRGCCLARGGRRSARANAWDLERANAQDRVLRVPAPRAQTPARPKGVRGQNNVGTTRMDRGAASRPTPVEEPQAGDISVPPPTYEATMRCQGYANGGR